MNRTRKEKPPEVFDPHQLTFAQLKEAHNLARISYKLTDSGIRNIEGGGATIVMRKGLWRVSTTDYDIPKFSFYMATHAGSILENGSPDKTAMLNALREMMEELGYRIIE